jgi:hypothetical protein
MKDRIKSMMSHGITGLENVKCSRAFVGFNTISNQFKAWSWIIYNLIRNASTERKNAGFSGCIFLI